MLTEVWCARSVPSDPSPARPQEHALPTFPFALLAQAKSSSSLSTPSLHPRSSHFARASPVLMWLLYKFRGRASLLYRFLCAPCTKISLSHRAPSTLPPCLPTLTCPTRNAQHVTPQAYHQGEYNLSQCAVLVTPLADLGRLFVRTYAGDGAPRC